MATLPEAPWATAVEALADDLRDAQLGQVVRVRLPLDGIASVMVSDGQGGATQRKLWSPADLTWLIREHPWAADALAGMLERRAARVASGEHAWRLAVMDREKAKVLTQDAQAYLKDHLLPDPAMRDQVYTWVADEAVRYAGQAGTVAWEYLIDPVWQFVLDGYNRAKAGVNKLGTGIKWLGIGVAALAATWAIGTAVGPWRRA